MLSVGSLRTEGLSVLPHHPPNQAKRAAHLRDRPEAGRGPPQDLGKALPNSLVPWEIARVSHSQMSGDSSLLPRGDPLPRSHQLLQECGY